MIAWLTGPPAAGKTTLARRVREQMEAPCVILDSDEVREALGMHGYTSPERDAFYRALGQLALLLERQQLAVMVAATGSKRAYRDAVRAVATRFIEVYVRIPPEREVNDVKGLYAQARAGAAPDLPSAGAPYEPPRTPEIVADGGFDDAAAQKLVEWFRGTRFAPVGPRA